MSTQVDINASKNWFLADDTTRTRSGPYSKEEVITLITGGLYGANDLMWHPPMKGWARIGNSELKDMFQSKAKNISPEEDSDESSEEEAPNAGKVSAKKKHPVLKGVLITASVIAVIVGGIFLLQNQIKQKVAAPLMADQMVSVASKSTGLNEDQVRDIMNTIPKEDQDKMMKIAANHISAGSINQLISAGQADGKEGVKNYLKQELTDDEQQELQQIADDNQDAVVAKAEEYGLSAEEAQELVPSLKTQVNGLSEEDIQKALYGAGAAPSVSPDVSSKAQ